ncbi:MAG: ATP-binding cassette domain-containing protein [Syntrophomonadaceae bacterium]|nr:ATP-binding cassette domain-containing protein [Syntrophomonadaceae bacterium]
MAAIKVDNLTYQYANSSFPALQSINLEVQAGEFVLLAGGSGSGKTSLLRAINGAIPHYYAGFIKGEVYLDNQAVSSLDHRQRVQTAGLLHQDAESQLVMNSVAAEIAFGMENMGMPLKIMRRRLTELNSALNLTRDNHKRTADLSAGQKQRVALAALLAMQPKILLLDEPTSQVDPVAAEEILTIIRRLNEDTGITVIMAEQRLERCLHLADRFIVMENGQIKGDFKNADNMARWAIENNCPFVPPVPRVFALAGHPSIPVTVKEGRQLLRGLRTFTNVAEHKDDLSVIKPISSDYIVEINKVSYTYPHGSKALRQIDFKLPAQAVTALIGDNGAGKTTLLKHVIGLIKPDRGKVTVIGRDTRYLDVEDLASDVGYLSQQPDDYLFLPTVREEISFSRRKLGRGEAETEEQLIHRLGLLEYLECNPRDLSTGQRQRVALASILISQPEILLLDEPTRGMDYNLKAELGEILKGLVQNGVTVLLVSHDNEFIAEYADEVALMAAGEVIAQGPTSEILSGSLYYAPQVNRLFNGLYEQEVLTIGQGVELLQKYRVRSKE